MSADINNPTTATITERNTNMNTEPLRAIRLTDEEIATKRVFFPSLPFVYADISDYPIVKTTMGMFVELDLRRPLTVSFTKQDDLTQDQLTSHAAAVRAGLVRSDEINRKTCEVLGLPFQKMHDSAFTHWLRGVNRYRTNPRHLIADRAQLLDSDPDAVLVTAHDPFTMLEDME